MIAVGLGLFAMPVVITSLIANADAAVGVLFAAWYATDAAAILALLGARLVGPALRARREARQLAPARVIAPRPNP